MDYPSLNSSTSSKFNWRSPDGLFGGLILIGVGIFGVMTLNKILPFIINLLTNLFTAVALGIGLTIVVALVWTNIGNIKDVFYLISRRIRSKIIKIDPYAPVDKFILDREADLQNAESGLVSLSGIIEKLKGKRDKAKVQQKDELERSRVAHEAGQQGAAFVAFRKATRRGKKGASLDTMIAFFEELYKRLMKYRDYVRMILDDTKDEVEEMKDQFESMREAHSVTRSMASFFSPNPNEKEKFEHAMQFMADDRAMKFGEIAGFFDQVQSVIASIDLDNMVIDAQALEQFRDWDKKVDRILFSPEERKILNAGSVSTFDDIFHGAETQQPLELPVRSGGRFRDYLND